MFDYRIFRTIRRTYNPLIFSKIKREPYSPVRQMCGSGCALNKFYVAISATNAIVPTSTSCFFRANSLLLAIKLPTLIPLRSVFFSSLYMRKHTRVSRIYCNMYLATSRTLLTQCEPGMRKRWKRYFFCGSGSAKNPPLPHRREEWRKKSNWCCYPL